MENNGTVNYQAYPDDHSRIVMNQSHHISSKDMVNNNTAQSHGTNPSVSQSYQDHIQDQGFPVEISMNNIRNGPVESVQNSMSSKGQTVYSTMAPEYSSAVVAAPQSTSQSHHSTPARDHNDQSEFYAPQQQVQMQDHSLQQQLAAQSYHQQLSANSNMGLHMHQLPNTHNNRNLLTSMLFKRLAQFLKVHKCRQLFSALG